MREVIVYYHVSDSALEDRQHRERWLDLLGEGRPLHAAMIEAAFAEFQLDPAGRQDLAAMLSRYVKRSVDQDRYDSLLPIAQGLMDAGYGPAVMVQLAAQAAYATHDFEQAKPYLEQLREQSAVTPVLGAAIDRLTRVMEAWEKEQELRA